MDSPFSEHEATVRVVIFGQAYKRPAANYAFAQDLTGTSLTVLSCRPAARTRYRLLCSGRWGAGGWKHYFNSTRLPESLSSRFKTNLNQCNTNNTIIKKQSACYYKNRAIPVIVTTSTAFVETHAMSSGMQNIECETKCDHSLEH